MPEVNPETPVSTAKTEMETGKKPFLLGGLMTVIGLMILGPGIFFFMKLGTLIMLITGVLTFIGGILVMCGRLLGAGLYLGGVILLLGSALLGGSQPGQVLGGMLIHGLILYYCGREMIAGNLE